MADSALKSFFLNTDEDESSVVKAPAFSLTKVMIVVAPLLTTLVTFVTDKLPGADLNGTNLAAIVISLVGFLAITGAADVIARGVATSAQAKADATVAAQTAKSGIVRFETPLSGRLALPGPDETVHVIAASDTEPPKYLCVREDSSLTWEDSSDVSLS